MKSITFGILILALVFTSPASALAATDTSDFSKTEERLVLQQKIDLLLAEVQRLQALIKVEPTSLSTEPYQSVFFDRPYEGIYFVDGIKLRSATRSDFIRPVDHELFKLLVDTIGEKAVREKVREWRVFYDEEEDLGGFVESIAGTDDWIFGVNRAEFDTADLSSTRLIVDLFIHEYAHLLLFDQPEFALDYAQLFWTRADKRHQAYVKQVGNEERFSVLTEYFEANQDRFVSDYATLSPDEDLAETFVSFAREEKGEGDTLLSKKINAFYSVPELVLVRDTLRHNLEELDVLD